MSANFDVEEVVTKASIAEKISLLAGKDFWHTQQLDRFNVPSVRLTDGPNGVRGTKFFNGVPAACLPCGTGLAATWDMQLLNQAGVLIGQECLAKGAHCWLGPTTNIQRSPLGGRGFESFSEDPYLSGKLAANYINGAQSTGVVSTIKHFVGNDQEHKRQSANCIISARALREIYLLPFQIALSESKPGAFMTAYNRVNGIHASENEVLLKRILREEWGADVLIMSDWYGTYSVTEALNASLDLEMPGPAKLRTIAVNVALSSGKLQLKTIDESARNVLKFVKRAAQAPVAEVEGIRDLPEDRALNRKLAADSVVLLKNDSKRLPLPKSIDRIALIGPSMKATAVSGGGSASLMPYYAISTFEGIMSKLPETTKVSYELGCYAHSMLPLLGSSCQRPDGTQGAVVSFYNQPPSVKDREIIDKVDISETIFQLMDYRNPRLDTLFWATIETTFLPPATGTYEFSTTVYGSGNLYIDDVLVVENTENQRAGTSFFGKGTQEEKGEIDLTEGSRYQVRLNFASSPTSKVLQPGVVAFPGGAGRIGAALKIDEEKSIARAAQIAKENEHTVVCIGLSGDWESEGFDRPHMNLPGSTSKLVSAVLEANPNAIIVTQSGTPINMQPWSNIATTQLHMWYGGNEGGNGVADVLFGSVNPSAKLPLTFPVRCEDNPAFLNWRSEGGRILYGEDIYVGYRFYDTIGREPLFPFGHGLSYTTFSLTDLAIFFESSENIPTISLAVTNTGSVDGSEVVQVYVAPSPSLKDSSPVSRAKKELRGFAKVHLKPNEAKRVEIRLDRFAGAFWDEVEECWIVEKGEYRLLVGTSSSDKDVVLEGMWVVEDSRRWKGL